MKYTQLKSKCENNFNRQRDEFVKMFIIIYTRVNVRMQLGVTRVLEKSGVHYKTVNL